MIDRAAWPYRMKDLSSLTGLPRQAIHFYIQQGLVPEGHKTGRNMAYYGEEHVARIKLVRELQHDRFLPLKAIRAVIDERDDAFSPAQRRLLVDVKERLGKHVAPRSDDARETVDAKELAARVGLEKKDLDEMIAIGLFAASPGPRGRLRIARDDAWIVELFGEVRAAGFTRKLGFPASIMTIYEDAMTQLFDRETALLTSKLSHLPADRVASMTAKVLPIISTFLARYHDTKVRHFFAAM